MLKTFGVELVSLVNSDPAWRVSKGSRSASRRARKAVRDSLEYCTGLISRSSEASEMPLSDSQKRGASILDCRFSKRSEYVPIKKRRFLLRHSPSPPPRPPSMRPPFISSEPTEETASLTKSHDASNKLTALKSASAEGNVNKIIDNTIRNCDKKSEKANKSFGETEDFSGIDIVAAAACSSSLGRECGYAEDGSGVEEFSAQEHAYEVSTITEARSSSWGLVKEDLVNSSEMSTGGTSSCVSTEPVGDLASISRKVTTEEGSKGVSWKVDSLTLSGEDSCCKDEETVGTQNIGSRDDRLHCSRVDRLHWDLNVVMDAWEHPLESPQGHNDVPHNISKEAGKSNIDDKAESLEGCDLQDKLATTSIAHNFGLLSELNQSLEDKVNHNIGYCHDVSPGMGLDEQPDCNRNLDIVKCTGEDSKSMCYNRTIKSTEIHDTASNPATQLSASGTMNEDDVSVQSLKLNGDEHLKARPVLEGLNLSSSGSCCALDNLRNTCASNDRQPSSVTSCPDIQREVIPNLAVLGNMKACSGSQYNVDAVTERDSLKTSEPLEDPLVTSDRNSHHLHPSTCVEVPNSSSTRCELPVALDSELHGDGNTQGESLVRGNDTIVNVSEISVSKETCDSVSHDIFKANLDKNFDCSDKIEAAKALDQNDDADFSCGHLSSVGNDAMIELPEDFDSQYEDGEVREPNEHPGEEYDGMDREAERVDYEANDMEICTPTGYHVSESGQVEDKENVGPEVAAIVSSSVSNDVDEVGEESANPIGVDRPREQGNIVTLNYASEEKMKASGSMELLEGRSTSSDMDIALSDDNGEKDRSTSHPETNAESKPSRRGLQSRIEGPVANDTSQEEQLNNMEFRYEESNSMRSFERPRYPFHNQSRRRHPDRWNSFSGNRRGGLRRHYSPIIHRHTKLEDDATMERDDVGYVDVQDDGSYSHQIHPRNRSGAEEDEYTGFHASYKPNRALSPGRPSTFGSGRSLRYGAFVDERARRGRYNGPSPDETFQSSFNYRHPLSHRDTSFSPFQGHAHSNAHHSGGKSPSESRSRSPVMWNSSRGRGAGRGGSTFVRQRSRSPNFRTETRIQRLRSGHQQADFEPDHAVGFRSIPRSHGSSHRRWNSAGKEEMRHFRDFGYKQSTSGLERSPGRLRSRGDRATVLESPQNLKPDRYYRISEDAAGRGITYEENYEGRSKHYGPLHPARHSYEDGVADRLHQDVDDSFSIAKGNRDRDASDFQRRGLRVMDSRINDLPRRFRGEQHSLLWERHGKFNYTSKQFGVDVMDPSHNLKSEEHYRSSRAGRFSDADGFKRGGRYESFADTRHYDSTNPMKHIDMEGSDKG